MLVDSAQRDNWHEGTSSVDGPDAEASSVLLSSNLRFGIHRGFEGRLSLPYAWMEARGPAGEASTSGVGDLLTELRWNGARDTWRYGFAIGSYWPVGELASQGLPATATFSTGTVDPSFSTYLSGAAPYEVGWSISTMARMVFAEQNNGRQLGSSYTTSLSLDRKLASQLSFQVQLSHFHREADEGMVMEDSGGDWLYLSPVLSYRFLAQSTQSLQATLGGRIPLVQDVMGRQLVESPSLNFGLWYTLEI